MEIFVKASVALHNFLQTETRAVYCPSGFVDGDNNGCITEGSWRDASEDGGLTPISQSASNNYTNKARELRDQLPSTLCHQMELSHSRRMLSRRFSSLTHHLPQSISISRFPYAYMVSITGQVQPPPPYVFDIIPVFLYCTVYHNNMVGWSTTFVRPLWIVFHSFTPCTFHVHTIFSPVPVTATAPSTDVIFLYFVSFYFWLYYISRCMK